MLQKNNRGVSPVIGIILMVAVTVGLVALAATIVFDLGSNVSEPADVSAELSADDSTSPPTITATVVRNDNAAKVFLRGVTSNKQYIVGGSNKKDVGGTGTVTKQASSADGTAEIVAIVEGTDGQEQVIRTLEY